MTTTPAAISLTSPAMLLAAAALVLPIAAHLLNRRARQRVTFPSITLLAEASAGQSRLFRLRRLILLALRCLAIVLLALTFARPMWVDQPAMGETGDGQAIVIVADVSASADQRAEGVSTFARLQAAALGTLDEVRPGRDVANLVVADASPEAAFAEPIPNSDSLRNDVQQLTPTAERADLPAAIALAADMLREQNRARRIVVVSDMQATNWEPVGAAQLAPGDGIEVVIVPAGEGEPANLGLSDPRVQPIRPAAGQPVELSIELVNYSPTEQEARVGLRIDDRQRERQRVTLGPWQGQRVRFDGITLDGDDEAAADVPRRITFALSDDALAADNLAHLVVHPSAQRDLALITDTDPADTAAEPYYLLRALAPHGDDRDALRITPLRPDALTDADLARYDAALLSDSAPLEPADRDALVDFVEAGGGLVVTASGNAALDRFDSLGPLAPFSPVSPIELEGDAMNFADTASAADVLDVFDALGRDALSRVAFRRVYTVEQLAEGAERLLRFEGDEPALVRLRMGEGRVVAANFSAAPGESDLASRGVFVPLVHTLLQAARSPERAEPIAHVGRPLAAPAEVDGGDWHDPEGERLTGRTRQAGFHTYRVGDTIADVKAVKVDPRESDLRRITREALQQRVAEAAETGGARLRHINDDGEPMHLPGRPLWHYFLLAALAMLALELAMLTVWRR